MGNLKTTSGTSTTSVFTVSATAHFNSYQNPINKPIVFDRINGESPTWVANKVMSIAVENRVWMFEFIVCTIDNTDKTVRGLEVKYVPEPLTQAFWSEMVSKNFLLTRVSCVY